jgi:hypothetical protein
MSRGPAWLCGLALVAACGAIAPPPPSPAPLNQCQASTDCGAFGNVQCLSGRCLVVQPAGNWTAFISLAQNAPYAPGSTFALSYNSLLESPPTSQAASSAGCHQGSCAQLPALVSDVTENFQSALVGDLRCSASAAVDADFYLGGTEVSMPVQATFVPKWGSAPYSDAVSLGLPLQDIVSVTEPNEGAERTPGPGGGPDLEFYVAGGLPPLVYERILMPFAPFTGAYPPDVQTVDLTASPLPSENPVWTGFDSTTGTSPGGARTLPTFTFQRADGGSLDGWTAYLRDATTLRRLSQLASLGGTSQMVKLITNHLHPAPGVLADALTGAQLAMAPAADSPMPTWIFTPVNGSLADAGTYPKLPPAVTVDVAVVSGNVPTAADLVFEAVDLCRYAAGSPSPQHDILSANHDFAYSVRTSAAEGHVSIQLPLGGYRVTAIPRDSENAVTVSTQFSLADGSCNYKAPGNILLSPLSTVTGTALVQDARPLAAATVEFVPTKCADGEVDLGCMPRGAQTTTSTSGSYTASLDPGGYLMRVRPAHGSGFSWVVQPLSVTASKQNLAPLTTVPAPVYAGLQLFDAQGDPAVGALVRVYEMPSSGTPYEIGEAITDANGHFDMYLDPNAQ